LNIAPDREMTSEQLARLEQLAGEQLAGGFAGVAFSPEYAPGTSREEILRIADKAAGQNGVLFFHARHSDNEEPGTNAEAIAEILDVARATGLGVHVSHITSTGGTFTMGKTLETLDQARSDGVDVTACMYPYDFWATRLGSFRFAGDWRSRFGIDFGDLQIGGTQTRLTAETFPAAQAENKLVAALGSIPSDEVDMAMRSPWIMIGSDAIAEPDANNHPRAAGTFARTLGVYVRERNVLSLMEALAKMTILPARRVEGMLPAMARKGRMQIGADADITVFDPATIIDRATVAAPATASVGISNVFVNGVGVLENGLLRQDRLPGEALKS
ncbi:MAG: amidohydrolase family protein, partial [Acidimicrobiia bacterium]|nr:amidohydrolase family protein [Acidimicrobiia bacterium]